MLKHVKKRIFYKKNVKAIIVLMYINKSCVQLPGYANNVALPAFTAAISCLLDHSTKPTAAGLLTWAHAVTDRLADRQTDTVPFHYAGSVIKRNFLHNLLYYFGPSSINIRPLQVASPF